MAVMPEPLDVRRTVASDGGSPAAVRAQVLATEHWSLLATRSVVWTESLSRANWFVTVLSAAVVALALIAQGLEFGAGFRVFAALLLIVVIVVGLATFARLMEINEEDLRLIVGMNRLRHAYVELAPEVEPYFVTGHFDDVAGIMRSYGFHTHLHVTDYVSSTPMMVGIINSVVAGTLAGLAADALGAASALSVGFGVLTTLITAAVLGVVVRRHVRRLFASHRPLFPPPGR
jgi:hypothetical protein